MLSGCYIFGNRISFFCCFSSSSTSYNISFQFSQFLLVQSSKQRSILSAQEESSFRSFINQWSPLVDGPLLAHPVASLTNGLPYAIRLRTGVGLPSLYPTLSLGEQSSPALSSQSTCSITGPLQLHVHEPPVTDLGLRRNTRPRQTSSRLKDFICNYVLSSNISPSTPALPSSLAEPGSSSLYPLTHFVSCSKFSAPHHHHFLPAVRTGIEISTYSAARSVPEWRHAMQ